MSQTPVVLPSELMREYKRGMSSKVGRSSPGPSYTHASSMSEGFIHYGPQGDLRTSKARCRSFDGSSAGGLRHHRPSSLDLERTRRPTSSRSSYAPYRSSPLSSPPIEASSDTPVLQPTLGHELGETRSSSRMSKSMSASTEKRGQASSKRLSFLGLNFSFLRKKKARPTPNLLLSENLFTSQYIQHHTVIVERSQSLNSRRTPEWH